jgi:uncharacterized protein (TIGR02246 family)
MQHLALWNSAGALLVLALTASAIAQEQPAESADAAAIRQQAEAYVTAYNAHDAAAVAACWTENAVYVHPDTGERITGRDEIQKMFAENFAADPAVKVEVTIDEIRLVSDSVAVEDGRARLISGEDTEPAETTYTAVHVKKDDKWLIDSVRETVVPQEPPEPLAESYENLEQLEWMVGEWIDESEESTVETSCRWAKNKSFLTRTFKLSAPGDDDLEGTQIIGWDPTLSGIRVWIFDSDGGFAEGWTTPEEGGAMVQIRGFAPDGRAVAATQHYRKIDDDSFTFSSTNRMVCDEALPDLGEVRVVRKPAASE